MKILISALLLAALAAPASALSTAQRNGEGGVTIRSNVSNGAVLDPGDRVAFQYQSARDAAVIVLDIDTQGYVTLLTDEPVEVSAREPVKLPNDNSELTAGGEPGVEFVFAVSVSDRDAIDHEALAAMRDETRRINGDPFIAANMLAGELVRDISQHTVFIGYTYFYVSDRVEYPCYLCGTCDGSAGSTECDGYRIAQNFDRNVSLSYPLARGYEMVETASQTETVTDSASDNVAIPDQPTEVNFYPYGSEVHYADPVAVNLWYTWGWYDPFYYYYPYSYPYYCSPWQVSIGFGWGWGWGGYYCGGWYDPWYGCGYYPYYGNGYYPYYPYADSRPVSKFKSQYKSGGAATLTGNRQYAMKNDADLRVASKTVRPTSTKASWNTTRSTRTGFSKDPFSGSSHRVKTSVSGSRSVTREAWSKGRSGSYRSNVPVYRSKVFQPKSSAGKSVIDRSGSTRVKGGSYAPQQRGTSTRSKSTWNAPSQRGGSSRPGGNSSYAPRTGTYKGSSGSFHGGSGWGGGGNRGFTGGGMRGGAMKGGRGR